MVFKRKKVVHLDPEAWEKKVKRIKTIVITLLAGILVGFAVSYLVRRVIIPGRAYGEAEAALEKGDLMEGIERLTLLGEYKDSEKRAAKLAHEECGSDYDFLNNAKVGDVIEFGHYEQDGSEMNGAEPIQWGVMLRDGNTIYLMAINVLDEHPYHTDKGDITWADSEMRSWLNSDFLNSAFSEKEQLLIAKKRIRTANNSVSGAKGGKDTEDRVFLMSHEELVASVRYSQDMSVFGFYAYPTKYALNRGVDPAGYGTAPWWLRTPGSSQSNVSVTDAKGEPIYVRRPDVKGIGVRPCIWVFFSRDDG